MTFYEVPYAKYSRFFLLIKTFFYFSLLASCDEVDDTVIQVTLHKNTILGFCIEGGLRAPGGDRPIRVKRFFKGERCESQDH